MPTWYFITLNLALAVLLVGVLVYSSYLEYKGVRPQLVMNWDAPEGAAVFLLLLCWFGLVPPERWIGGLSLIVPVFWCLRAMYRGHKANALMPYSTNTKDTSWT
jgi:hypothetical protein